MTGKVIAPHLMNQKIGTSDYARRFPVAASEGGFTVLRAFGLWLLGVPVVIIVLIAIFTDFI